MPEQRFKSKVDPGLVLFASAGVLAPFGMAAWRMANGLGPGGAP